MINLFEKRMYVYKLKNKGYYSIQIKFSKGDSRFLFVYVKKIISYGRILKKSLHNFLVNFIGYS